MGPLRAVLITMAIAIPTPKLMITTIMGITIMVMSTAKTITTPTTEPTIITMAQEQPVSVFPV